MLNNKSLLLYLCSERSYIHDKPIEQAVEEAIAGGVTMVQIREKNASSREFYEIALKVQNITKKFNIPLVINDRFDIALAIAADGVHVGETDIPVAAIRKIAGNKLFIGATANTAEEAIEAQKNGADYIGAGPVYPTKSKVNAKAAIGLATLSEICRAVKIPVIGIGGIDTKNACKVINTGVAGIAIISAILSQKDIKYAAAKLRNCYLTASKGYI
jgi:thiamine-phosphate pyrophosphorylase